MRLSIDYRPLLLQYRILCALFFLLINKRRIPKSSHSKNGSKRSLVYTVDSDAIKIEDVKTNLNSFFIKATYHRRYNINNNVIG